MWHLPEIADHLDLIRLDYVAKHNEQIKYGIEVIVNLFRLSSGDQPNISSMRLWWLLNTKTKRKIG